MGLVEEQDRFLGDVARLILHARERGFVVTGGELFRTPEQQAIHQRSGRSRSMDSQHLRRLAIDLNFFMQDGDRLSLCSDRVALRPLGEFWRRCPPGRTAGAATGRASRTRRISNGAAGASPCHRRVCPRPDRQWPRRCPPGKDRRSSAYCPRPSDAMRRTGPKM